MLGDDWCGWRGKALGKAAPLTHDMALQLIHHSVYSHPADHLLIEMAQMPDCPASLLRVVKLVYQSDWQEELLQSIRIELKELPAAQSFAKRFKGNARQQEERIHVNYLEMKVMAGILIGSGEEDGDGRLEAMAECLALHYAVDLRPSPAFLRALQAAPSHASAVRELLGLQPEKDSSNAMETTTTSILATSTPPAPACSSVQATMSQSRLQSRLVVDHPGQKSACKTINVLSENPPPAFLVPETPLKKKSRANSTEAAAALILQTPPRLSLEGSSSSNNNAAKLRRLELN